MPHRGRLNVLANILRKPYEMILAEFEGSFLTKQATGDGDVKYHLGYSHDRHDARRPQGASVAERRTRATSKPSTRSIEGMVRAKQNHLGDTERARVVPILMHGDAAFTGPGRRVGDARALRARGLPHRRHHPHHREQPDRLHDVARGVPLHAVSERRREDHPGAGLPRERRRSRGGRAGGAARDRVPTAVQEGRHHRSRLLPASRAQRARRPELHAADDVQGDRRDTRRRSRSIADASPPRASWPTRTSTAA